MFHFQAKKLLTAYLDGELSPVKIGRVEKHIQSCILCQKELGELRKLDSILDHIAKPEERTEFYWQTQQKNILQKAEKPVSKEQKKPLLEKPGKPAYWKLATSGTSLIIIIFAAWYGINQLPQRTLKSPEHKFYPSMLEAYRLDENSYPERKMKAPQKPLSIDSKKRILDDQDIAITGTKSAGNIVRGTSLFAGNEMADKTAQGGQINGTVRKDYESNIPAEALSRIPESQEVKKDSGTIKSEFLPQTELKEEVIPIDKLKKSEEKLSLDLSSSPPASPTSAPENKPAEEWYDKDKRAIQPERARYIDKTNLSLATKKSQPATQSEKNVYYGEGIVIGRDTKDYLESGLEKRITLNFKDMPISQALETIATTANIKVLVISPQLEKQITTEFKSIPLDSVMDQIGKLVGLPYTNKSGDTFILSPQPIDLYTGRGGYASPTNEILFFERQPTPSSTGLGGILPSQDSTQSKYLCPVCKKIELNPEWTYCPLDGSKIDSSIFQK